MKAQKWIILILGVVMIFLYVKHCAGPDKRASRMAEQMKHRVEKSERAALQAKLREVKGAVQAFQTGEGRLPASLGELVAKGYIGSIPARIGYDAANGEAWINR